MTLRTMSSEQARTGWNALLDLASWGDVDIVIERCGKPTAVVIGYETYRALQPTLAGLRVCASAQERGWQMAAILQELAELPDPVAIWEAVEGQSEQRQDRPLPGRESEFGKGDQ
jgi:PHD/YefM family antitoxin component YafN of YafNO toxin-antitoxin module